MWDSFSRGYRLAVVVLGIELIIALALFSDSLGLFAILAMTLVGIAWLPAALMIFSELQQEAHPGFFAYVVAILCGLAGSACLVFFAKWTVLGLFV